MVNKILIAVDGSKHALKSVEFGAEIAKSMNAEVLLFHVVKPYNLPESLKKFAEVEHMATIDADLLKIGAQHLLTAAHDVAKAAGLKDVEIEAEEGPIARTIVARSESFKADMIIIGSRGMGDIEGMLRGGVSHRVEVLAKCPVLVVK